MTSKFLNLHKEKQQRILNAALNEFANKGFDRASTNEIVKSAGISKGLLFHYFNNKKELYLFLHEYFIEILMKEFFTSEHFAERDVFERLKKIMISKSHLMKKYPEIFDFYMSAYIETSSEIKNELTSSHFDLMALSYSRIFENIDTSKFKEGIDMNKAIDIISWTLEGYGNQVMSGVKGLRNSEADFTREFAEADVYIDMLKRAFYK